MVFIEEVPADVEEKAAEVISKEETATTKQFTKGFLQKEHEPLYPPEGSKEGHVAPETHKAHQQHKMNENINAQMNRGAKDNNRIERPPWYSSDWPKDCQYNSPGCSLGALETSSHATDLHKDMVRRNDRWEEIISGVQQPSVRCSFMHLCDEDVQELIKALEGNDVVTELDLSHNKIKDQGVQSLVAALSKGAAPNLQELRLYKNEFGDLGRTMLTKGLSVLRKKLKVILEEPTYALKTSKDAEAEKPAQ